MSKRRPRHVDTERQAALEKLGELYLEFASSPEGQNYLEAQQIALVAPRNDPDYLKAIMARDKEREGVASEITHVHHVVEGAKNYLALTLRNDRDHAKARQIAGILQRHYEAELRYHKDGDTGEPADYEQPKTPRHDFGREKRSLGNRRGK